MSQNKYQKFDQNELKTIKWNFSNRKRIEQALKKFQFSQKLSNEQNIQNLCKIIQNCLSLQNLGAKFISAFKQYINIDSNIPIEINFKSLKYQQLIILVEEWENSLKQLSGLLITQRLYTINHRNILFNRVFVEEKTNIEEYFETLSDKKMLKAVDIYKLVVDILSHYYLYEYACDNQTFFQKINSFNNFLQIVEKFKNSQKRIVIDNKSKDFDYIKIYEFQALINFWQTINPELQLRSDVRFSICNVEIQTERHMIMSVKDSEMQTVNQNSKKLTLQAIINKSLKELNRFTEDEQEPEKLQIIQNICQTLRRQKIKLCQLQKRKKNTQNISSIGQGHRIIYPNLRFEFQQQDEKSQSQKTQKISIRNQSKQKCLLKTKGDKKNQTFIQSYQNSDVSFLNFENHSENRKRSQQRQNHRFNNVKCTERNKSKPIQQKNERKNLSQERTFSFKKDLLIQFQDNNNNNDNESESEIFNLKDDFILSLFEKIFQHYSDGQVEAMNVQNLNDFFVDIGIIQKGQTSFTFNLIRKSRIKNLNKITIIDFIQMMEQIRKEDQDLTDKVIQEFVDVYINKKAERQRQKVSLKTQNSYSNQKSLSNLNVFYENRQPSSEKKSRRYKYSEQTPDLDFNSMIRARQRGSVPLIGQHRFGMQRKSRF